MKRLKLALSLLMAAVMALAFASATQTTVFANCYWWATETCADICPNSAPEDCGVPTPNTLAGGYFSYAVLSGSPSQPHWEDFIPAYQHACNCLYTYWNGFAYDTATCPFGTVGQYKDPDVFGSNPC